MKKISIRGPIVSNNVHWIYELFDIDATSPRKVQKELGDANGQDIEVEVNSGGGSVFDGSEIYTSLKEHKANVTVKIMGLAASAASFIAMAGDKILMSPTSQMMMHNASSIAIGDYRDFDHESGVLQNVNQTIANAYRMKSGMSDEKLLKMMDNETWLTPQQALESKLADEIMFEQSGSHFVASTHHTGILPQQVIDKMMNDRFNQQQQDQQQQNEPTNQSSLDDDNPEEDFYMHNLRKKKLEILNKEVM